MKNKYLFKLIVLLLLFSLAVFGLSYCFYQAATIDSFSMGFSYILIAIFIVTPATTITTIMLLSTLGYHIRQIKKYKRKELIQETNEYNFKTKKFNKTYISYSFLFYLIIFIPTFLILTNKIQNEKAFNSVIKKQNINYVSYSDVLYEDYYGDGLQGISSIRYYYLKLKDDKVDLFLSQFNENNISYEKDMAFEKVLTDETNRFYHKYEKKIPKKYQIDFNRKYYYMTNPILFYPEDNELIIFYFDDWEDGKNWFNYDMFKTRKMYFELIQSKYGLYDLKYEDLVYFFDNSLGYKRIQAYYYFDISYLNHELDNQIIELLGIENKTIEKAKIDDIIGNHQIKEEYRIIYDEECYYKIYNEEFIVFYPKRGILILFNSEHI